MINRIPRSVKITATATGMIVAGAGTTAANGHYTENGTENGKAVYFLDGGDQVFQRVYWSTSQWTIIGAGGLLYYSEFTGQDAATPDLVDTWSVFLNGSPPVPTVVAG